jgi:hypothetical protein
MRHVDGKSFSQSDETALMNATWAGRVGCVRLLIDAGADKDARNNVCAGRRSLLCISTVGSLHSTCFQPHFCFAVSCAIFSFHIFFLIFPFPLLF